MIAFVEFDKSLPRQGFDCGNESLNSWFHTQAGQQERANTARTHLGLSTFDSCIASYFSLVTYRLEVDELQRSRDFAGKKYPMSAMLLARLAVDKRYQGQRIGSLTLGHALRLLAEASKQIGFEIVVVHAIDASAAAFYQKHGFEFLTDDGSTLFLLTKTLVANLAIVQGGGN
ncbi:GNAT family N-acetyltransferase [Demequina capsici]|uniref:GNAT family N-acetyltransferase n=1 Tax=Demequina capsici TaxID=3075620 RepID=A0AA96F3V9_9MICO|nr:GNAT family N-acetyltransferase [Demequina sp. OYTSA14]WNM23526.1 GNAT family N-acetyltransferase [Demequina sp. OYTSA14]